MLIRDEIDGDGPEIRALVTAAMKHLPQSSGTEADIVDGLRADEALSLSLVAEDGGEVVGYLAVSAAQIGNVPGWALIGPLAVLPARHREGIGSALMAEAIRRSREGCAGMVLVGDPGYYGRFGFRSFARLRLGDLPPEFIQALPFDTREPEGELLLHPAFGLQQG